MSAYIPDKLRQFVWQRAAGRCEYCRLPETDANHKHEPDHIIPRQHDGETTTANLALTCWRCNRHKGTNLGSFDPATRAFSLFFNPRTQVWEEHFRLEGALLQPLTPEARVTARILRFNDSLRVAERGALLRMGLYG